MTPHPIAHGLRFIDCTPAGPDRDATPLLRAQEVRPDELLSIEVFYDPARLDAVSARAIGTRLAPARRLPVSVIPTISDVAGAGPVCVQATARPPGAVAVDHADGACASGGDVVATHLVAAPGAGDIVEQSHAILGRLRELLAGAGTGLDDVVKFNIFYKGGGDQANWARAAEVRASYYREPGPATTGIPIPRFEDDACEIAMQVLAVRGARARRRHVWPENHWDWPFHLPYKHGLHADDLVFIGGQVPLDGAAGVLAAGDFPAQMQHTMTYIDRVLTDLGVPRRAVSRLTAFVAVDADTAAERLATLHTTVSAFFDGETPALVPVVLPVLAYPAMDVEIEVQARWPEPG